MENLTTEIFSVLSVCLVVKKYEPPPEEGGMYWRGFRSLAKEFGFELPGPKGPGFWRPDEYT